MLQIATGKFFKQEVGQENRLRGVLYTNYRSDFGDEGLETAAGRLTATSTLSGLQSFVYEVVERYEGGPSPGVLVSVGAGPFLQEMAAIVSFGLDITCTPDPDLARRLLGDAPLAPNAYARPKSYLNRVFETEINAKPDDGATFATFAQSLIDLERAAYLGAMRAIRTYVGGLQRLGDDIDLAYTLLVASMESLVQGFDGHRPGWPDFDETKRKRVDGALVGAPKATAQRVRAALLDVEHVALARRFKAYALEHLPPSYFRDDAVGHRRPIGRADLAVALDQAYRIRSKYVHTLAAIPKQLVYVHDDGDYVSVGGQPTLTVEGLARLARTLILAFVRNAPKTKVEDYNFSLDIPGVVEVELAAQYWVWKHEGFQPRMARKKLAGALELHADLLLETENASLVDLRDLLREYEPLIAKAVKSHRLPMLALYYLFHVHVPPSQRLDGWIEVVKPYEPLLNAPSQESLALHIALRKMPGWTAKALTTIREQYFRTRYRENGMQFPWVFEAAMDLILAEARRREGDEAGARTVIAELVENHPTVRLLANFESTLAAPMAPIDWRLVLLPATAEQAGEDLEVETDETEKTNE